MKIAELKNKLEYVRPAAPDEQAAASLRLALQTICEVIVTKLGYEAAWIGLNDEMRFEVKSTSRNGVPEVCDIAPDTEIRSAISFPLKIGDVAIGTLRVHSDKENAFDSKEAKILEVFSETAACAVERANVNAAGLSVGIARKNVKQSPKKVVGPGEVYVFRGTLEELLELFRNHLENGWSGLLICGRSTDRIIGVDQLRSVPTFEITGDASLINAVWSYSGLTTLVESFMRATEKPLVVVDTLEKLESSPQRGHLQVFIEDLRKQVREVNGSAIIRMESIENRWLGTIEKFCRFL